CLSASGSPGSRRAVLLCHRGNVNSPRHTVSLLGYTPGVRLYSVFPLFHSNARYCSVMAAAEAGAALVLDRGFSASRVWDPRRAHGITASNSQGAMPSILHQRPPPPDDAGDPVPRARGPPPPP